MPGSAAGTPGRAMTRDREYPLPFCSLALGLLGFLGYSPAGGKPYAHWCRDAERVKRKG